jgi:hypothetical protein
MSGFLILLAASFLFDEPLPAPAPARTSVRESSERGETLPAPRQPAAPAEKTKLISSTTQPPPSAPATSGTPTQEAKIGWGVDPSDNSMYMVIQIAPSAIETFAAGQRGQELTSRIPPILRNRIDKVIVRFGTGPVEQFPSESELASMPLAKSTTPQIANLDRRTLVNIDQPHPSEVVPTVSTTQIPIAPGAAVPGTTASPSAYSAPPAYTSPPPVWNNNVPSTRPAGTTTTAPTDGFAPSTRPVPQSLLPFGGSRPSPGYPSTAGTQGNVTYSGTATSGNNYGNAPYGNQQYGNQQYGNTQYGNQQYGTSAFGSNVPMVASNPSTGVYPPVNESILPNGSAVNGNMNAPNTSSGFFASNPNYPPNNNYGLPVSTNGPTYATTGSLANPLGQPSQGPILPPPNLLPSTSNNGTTSSGWRLPPLNDQDDRRDVLNSTRPGSWVPFFLVLSFILNVYFGLWLNHLSTKYRHLLANMRGLSVPELERA